MVEISLINPHNCPPTAIAKILPEQKDNDEGLVSRSSYFDSVDRSALFETRFFNSNKYILLNNEGRTIFDDESLWQDAKNDAERYSPKLGEPIHNPIRLSAATQAERMMHLIGFNLFAGEFNFDKFTKYLDDDIEPNPFKDILDQLLGKMSQSLEIDDLEADGKVKISEILSDSEKLKTYFNESEEFRSQFSSTLLEEYTQLNQKMTAYQTQAVLACSNVHHIDPEILADQSPVLLTSDSMFPEDEEDPQSLISSGTKLRALQRNLSTNTKYGEAGFDPLAEMRNIVAMRSEDFALRGNFSLDTASSEDKQILENRERLLLSFLHVLDSDKTVVELVNIQNAQRELQPDKGINDNPFNLMVEQISMALLAKHGDLEIDERIFNGENSTIDRTGEKTTLAQAILSGKISLYLEDPSIKRFFEEEVLNELTNNTNLLSLIDVAPDTGISGVKESDLLKEWKDYLNVNHNIHRNVNPFDRWDRDDLLQASLENPRMILEDLAALEALGLRGTKPAQHFAALNYLVNDLAEIEVPNIDNPSEKIRIKDIPEADVSRYFKQSRSLRLILQNRLAEIMFDRTERQAINNYINQAGGELDPEIPQIFNSEAFLDSNRYILQSYRSTSGETDLEVFRGPELLEAIEGFVEDNGDSIDKSTAAGKEAIELAFFLLNSRQPNDFYNLNSSLKESGYNNHIAVLIREAIDGLDSSFSFEHNGSTISKSDLDFGITDYLTNTDFINALNQELVKMHRS